jgi:hypothetical protein
MSEVPRRRPTDERLKQVYDRAEAEVERRWGVPVRISDVPAPFTGDLDGAEIAIDYENDVEGAVFLLVHLFGHTVQWNVRPDARDLATRAQQNPSEATLAALEEYEREACEYSLRLLHDCGVRDLDQWVADYARCDFAYLRRFYATGEKAPFFGFWRDGSPLLEPREIPPFQPQRWKSRWDGIVV